MYHTQPEEETNEEFPEIQLEEVEVTPEVQENVAEALTDKELDSKISKIVDEKVALAQASTDDEEEILEDEDEEGQSLGIFPFIIIGGVVLVGIASIFLKNSPDTSPTSHEENYNG